MTVVTLHSIAPCALRRIVAATLCAAFALALFPADASAQPMPGGQFKGSGKNKKKEKKEDEPPKHADKLYKLPSMKINRPLMDIPEFEATEKKLRKLQYKAIITTPKWNANAQKIVPMWVEWRLKSFTMKKFKVTKKEMVDGKFEFKRVEVKNNPYERRTEFEREIRVTGGIPGRVKADDMRTFRANVCKEIVKQSAKLLDNNFFVRLNVTILVANLDVMPRQPLASPPQPPQAYAGSVPFLVDKVLLDTKQPDALKLIAANGLKRIGNLGVNDIGRLTVTLREKAAKALMKEFERRKTHTWYQRRLAEALGALDVRDIAGKADIIQALGTAMGDATRDPRVRAQAAFALSRASKPGNLNVDLLAYEYIHLAHSMAKQYNAEIAAKKLKPHWPNSFRYLYLSFRPVHRYEDMLYARRVTVADRKPWLSARYPANAKVTAAFGEIKNVASFVIKNIPAPIPPKGMAALSGWMATHKPKNFSLQPGVLPAIRPKKVAARGNGGANGVRPKKTVQTSGP